MQSLHVEYHYQAKADARATFTLDKQILETEIIEPLKTADKITLVVKSDVHDILGNHLCTATVTWQIKKWKKVAISAKN